MSEIVLCDYHARNWRKVAASSNSNEHFRRQMLKIVKGCGDCRARLPMIDPSRFVTARMEVDE